MRFFSGLVTIAAALTAYAEAVDTTFNAIYDNPNTPLAVTACSKSSSSGFQIPKFDFFGELPTFPNIGGAPDITMFNDPDCGSCWNLTFTDTQGRSRSVVITAIDTSSINFNISETAMNTLTNGQAEQLGIVPVTATRLAMSACGL